MQAQAARNARAISVVLAAAAALAAVAYAVNRGAPEVGAPAARSPTTEIAAAPPAGQPAEQPAGPGAAPEAPAEAGTEGPAVPTAAPTFDVVRVAPDGSALVAGTAAPGAEVTIYAGDAPLAETTADADGNFVAMFDAAPSAAPQALTLGVGDRRSSETVMLLPDAPTLPANTSPPSAAATEGAAEPTIAATAIVREDTVEVVPAPGSGGDVVLGAISYGEEGAVTLDGVGRAGSAVRAYVDGRLAEEAAVGADGRWQLSLDDVDAGLYTLRIDQVDPDGRVASRVETPFQRDFPRAPLPRPGTGAETGAETGAVPPGGTITVQPGNNLWTIARSHYGSGMLYTQIFTANQDLIRDPELIYPGQIFTMPAADAPPPAAPGMPRPRRAP
jgi:nucleoid-associated protein YgaU